MVYVKIKHYCLRKCVRKKVDFMAREIGFEEYSNEVIKSDFN